MNIFQEDDQIAEFESNNIKADRQKKLETQRKIFELKEKQRLKRELDSDYDDWDWD